MRIFNAYLTEISTTKNDGWQLKDKKRSLSNKLHISLTEVDSMVAEYKKSQNDNYTEAEILRVLINQVIDKKIREKTNDTK